MTSPAPVRCWPESGGGPAPPATARRRALFLDRDGVINVNHGYVHTPAETRFLPGIFDLTGAAREAGFIIIVATNQAGIARGFYGVAQFIDYTRWMHEEFAARGVCIEATYFCPHHPVAGVGEGLRDCDCRKPKPGMLLAAAARFGIDLGASVMVGDSDSDAAAAAAAGVGRTFILARDDASVEPPAQRVQSLAEVQDLLGRGIPA